MGRHDGVQISENMFLIYIFMYDIDIRKIYEMSLQFMSFIRFFQFYFVYSLLSQLKNRGVINPLKTKRRPLYLETQFVPRSKHFSFRL